jgi:HEAT repeat protein
MVPTLRLLLRDADATVRVSAARSLWRLAAEESALPVMIELLSAKQDDVRRAAATGLGEIGPAAKKAVPALKRAVHADDDQFVQRLAAKALEKISPDKPKAR